MSQQEHTRRLAAVWFADVAGYVTLSGRDAEAAMAIVAELQRVSQKIVEQYGGLVLRFIGDSAIAAFDSTEIAVRAALDLQTAFQSSDIVLRHGSGLRIGVHVGEIVETADGDVHGDGVNIASRLQAVAETGRVVLSESAARQVEDRDDFELRSLGSHEFKGVKRPMEVYAVKMAGTEDAVPGPELDDAGQSALAEALSDRYRVEHEIGRGGMATVYKAHDIRHDRPVALKVMHQELTDAIGAERFLREIQVTANLQHPHILPLFDSGEVGGRLFYVMPMVDGVSLKGRLKRETQLGITETIKIVRDVASALAHAHERGVVHRDIKPENILFSGDYALLADFGVARAVTQAAEGGLTRKGLAMGSPPYMAPEQMKDSGTIDGRTDVYALGCVMYEMLVGSPPFTGSTAQVVMARHATDPVPPIRSVRSNVPEELEAVVMRCLAKVQADRFADASTLVAALDAVSRSHAASPSGTPQGVAPPPSAAAPQTAPTYPTPGTGQQAVSGSYDTDQHSGEHSFLGELKRRKVYQAGVIYLVFAMGAVQAAELAFPTFGIEAYFDFVVMGSMLGFPLVLVLAWAYDLTTKGLRRADPYGKTLGAGVSKIARYGTRLRVMGFVGLLVFLGVFPLHRSVTVPSVDLSRRDARVAAESFLAGVGWGGAFQEVSTFDPYANTNAFLQETAGLRWASGPLGDQIASWSWNFRWFRPGETDEWRVSLGSNERLLLFEHTIARTEEGANLAEEEARVIAEEFVAGLEIDVAGLVRLGTSSSTLENRTRHQFSWRIPQQDISWTSAGGETEQGVGHIHVRVDGDRVEMYQNHFERPEGFSRARSGRGVVWALLFGTMSFGLVVTAILLLVSAVRKKTHTIRWKRAAIAGGGIALVGGLSISTIIGPAQFMELGSELPALAGAGLIVLTSVLAGGFVGCVYFVLIAVGEALAGQYYPGMLESWNRVWARDWRSPVLVGDVLHGVFLGGVLLGVDGLASLTMVNFPGASGIAPDEGLSLLGSPWTTASLGLSMLMDSMVGQLGLFAALVILRKYLKSSAVAIVVLALVGSLSTDVPMTPAYLGAAFSALTFAVVALALVRWGPIMVITAVFTQLCVSSGLVLALVGNAVAVRQGVGLIAIGLIPLVYTVLAWAASKEVGDSGSTPTVPQVA